MIPKLSLGNLAVPPSWISRVQSTFGGDSQVSRKSWGEAPPKIADIRNNPFLQALFAQQGVVGRLKRKLNTLSKKKGKVVPAHGIIAMAHAEDGVVYVGIEFVAANHQNEDLLAGVMAHEWGHLNEDLPPGFDPEKLNWNELHELRRDKEAEADAYAGQALARIEQTPREIIEFLKNQKTKTKTHKYHNVETRIAIIERAHSQEKQRQSSLKNLKFSADPDVSNPFTARVIAVV